MYSLQSSSASSSPCLQCATPSQMKPSWRQYCASPCSWHTDFVPRGQMPANKQKRGDVNYLQLAAVYVVVIG